LKAVTGASGDSCSYVTGFTQFIKRHQEAAPAAGSRFPNGFWGITWDRDTRRWQFSSGKALSHQGLKGAGPDIFSRIMKYQKG
jgi:hypothetical protein